jgi:hypothetical protein
MGIDRLQHRMGLAPEWVTAIGYVARILAQITDALGDRQQCSRARSLWRLSRVIRNVLSREMATANVSWLLYGVAPYQGGMARRSLSASFAIRHSDLTLELNHLQGPISREGALSQN